MTVSYNWLKDYLKFDLSPEKVAEVLTFTGLEVEHVETVEQIPGGLAGVLECLKDANVNVEYIYAFTSDKPGQAYMILRPDDETAAMKALRGAGIRQVEQEELSEM